MFSIEKRGVLLREGRDDMFLMGLNTGVALVAQLVQHSPSKQSVVGSNPTKGSSSFFLGKKSCPGCG